MHASRTTFAALLVLALAAPAAAFDDLHLNEITEEARTYARARVVALEGIGSLTKPQKQERKQLVRLLKKLDKPSTKLAKDFGKLKGTAGASRKLKDAAVGLQPGLDAAFAGAELHLSERHDYVEAHLPLITNPKSIASLRNKLAKADGTRDAADAAAAVPTKRAKLLAKAERLLTSTLKKAEKFALRDSQSVPPKRFRSGDVVGSPGGVVAVASDDPSNIAGFSVLIRPGLLSTATAISLEPADSFVGGDDVPAGNAVRILPESLTFTGPVDVSVRFLLPPDSNIARLALFQQRGQTVTAGLGGTLDVDFLTLGVTEFGVFQAGVQAPPPGTPDGRYHMQTLLLASVGDPQTGTVLQSASVSSQDFLFNPTMTGSRNVATSQVLARQLLDESPNHEDFASSSLLGGQDFVWEGLGAGRFRFTFLEGTAQIDVEGVASDDSNVISFTGRGDGVELFAVGVRASQQFANAADLDGRWAGVEIGVSLLSGTGTPFGARQTSAFRTFTANGVDSWTYDQSGAIYNTDLLYNTDSAGAEHTSSVGSLADGGSEDFTVLANGQVSADTDAMQFPRRTGWLDENRRVFVSTRGDLDAREVSLMIAVRQPGGNQAGTFDGAYYFSRLGVDVSTAQPASQTSSHTIFPVVGALSVVGTSATVTPEDGATTTYEVTGTPPLNAMTWGHTRTLTPVDSAPSGFTLVPDADGNHRPLSDLWWYAVGETGDVIIGMTAGESGQSLRGILIGVK